MLVPILFLLYINDMPEGVNSYMNLFADDANLLRQVKNKDCKILQGSGGGVGSGKWNSMWISHVMKQGRSGRLLKGIYRIGDSVKLKKVNKERDLGVIIQENSQQDSYVYKMFGKTYNLVRNIGLDFQYMNNDMKKLNSRLKYAGLVWSQHENKRGRKLERLQRMAMNII